MSKRLEDFIKKDREEFDDLEEKMVIKVLFYMFRSRDVGSSKDRLYKVKMKNDDMEINTLNDYVEDFKFESR